MSHKLGKVWEEVVTVCCNLLHCCRNCFSFCIYWTGQSQVSQHKGQVCFAEYWTSFVCVLCSASSLHVCSELVPNPNLYASCIK
jgi:hypothetical protein